MCGPGLQEDEHTGRKKHGSHHTIASCTHRQRLCCCFLHWAIASSLSPPFVCIASVSLALIIIAIILLANRICLQQIGWRSLMPLFMTFFLVLLPSVDCSLSPSLCVSVCGVRCVWACNCCHIYRECSQMISSHYARCYVHLFSCTLIRRSIIYEPHDDLLLVNSQFHSITFYNRTILVNFLWFQQAQLLFFSPSCCALYLFQDDFNSNSTMGETRPNRWAVNDRARAGATCVCQFCNWFRNWLANFIK